MTAYQNPFRYRASEQQRDLRAFLKSFGPGALRMLPEALWDRLVIFRSAPGAGKTSLMRVFLGESLSLIAQDRESFPELAQELERLGALTTQGGAVFGVYLNLDRDYRSFADVTHNANGQSDHKLMFRLLNVRLMMATLRASLLLVNKRFPEDIGSISLVLDRPDVSAEEASTRLGGLSGVGIYRTCRDAEREMISKLDSLLPVEWSQSDVGHNEIYALWLLSQCTITIDGAPIKARPLFLLDDVHRLDPQQRVVLLERLANRSLTAARWVAERYEALSDQEIMVQVGKEERDVELVEIEAIARGMGRLTGGQFEKVLVDIGNRRAYRSLSQLSDQPEEFFDLLDFDGDELLLGRGNELVKVLSDRVVAIAGDDSRYAEWIQGATHLAGFRAVVHWRELEVLILRDKERRQGELFAAALPRSEIDKRSSSGVREACELAIAREFDLPFYAGPDRIPKLGSVNVEQFLTLGGDLFSEMLAELTLQRRPRITALRQHRIARRISQRFWREIARRVPDGANVQRLIAAIAKIGVAENSRPTVPYPPGVTGTAMLMTDRQRLLSAKERNRIPGADILFSALSKAIAYNVVSAEMDRPSKNKQVMVIYLNRLLCPAFWMPLGRGGFRERRLEAMAKWMLDPVDDQFFGSVPEQLSL